MGKKQGDVRLRVLKANMKADTQL